MSQTANQHRVSTKEEEVAISGDDLRLKVEQACHNIADHDLLVCHDRHLSALELSLHTIEVDRPIGKLKDWLIPYMDDRGDRIAW